MPKNLLLADDSVTIQRVVAITFANEDYAVSVVANGEDAVAKARAARPDVILLDALMPKLNGYDACAAVKADPALSGVPVILLAGTFEPFDEARCKAVGADAFLQKPFESQALINKVRELVEGKAPVTAPGSTPLAFGVQGAAPAPASPQPVAAPQPLAASQRAPAAPPPVAAPAARPPPGAFPPAGARPPPGAMAPPGARPPAGAVPPAPNRPSPGALAPPGAMPPPGARPPPGAMPPPGARPQPTATLPFGAMPPPPAARPFPPAQPATAAMPFTFAPPAARPAAPPPPAPPPVQAPALAPQPDRRDAFGLGLGPPRPAAVPLPPPPPPAPPPAAGDDDWSDIEVTSSEPIAPRPPAAAAPPAALAPPPAPPAAVALHPEPEPSLELELEATPSFEPIDLPAEEPGETTLLAPMHEFVPAAGTTGHQPAPAPVEPPVAAAPPATPADGGEALLREALSRASRDVIERVVWEVVPQLAETIIRENLDRLIQARQG